MQPVSSALTLSFNWSSYIWFISDHAVSETSHLVLNLSALAKLFGKYFNTLLYLHGPIKFIGLCVEIPYFMSPHNFLPYFCSLPLPCRVDNRLCGTKQMEGQTGNIELASQDRPLMSWFASYTNSVLWLYVSATVSSSSACLAMFSQWGVVEPVTEQLGELISLVG